MLDCRPHVPGGLPAGRGEGFPEDRGFRRVGVFGWGVVAPKSRDVEAFVRNLDSQEIWLSPFDGFGPDNFLVGWPDFDLRHYEGWIAERFPPNRFQLIERKMGLPVQYAIGSFIQALGFIKEYAARVNLELGLLDRERAGAIAGAAREVADGTHDRQFVVGVFQTGSGTSTNMNAKKSSRIAPAKSSGASSATSGCIRTTT